MTGEDFVRAVEQAPETFGVWRLTTDKKTVSDSVRLAMTISHPPVIILDGREVEVLAIYEREENGVALWDIEYTPDLATEKWPG